MPERPVAFHVMSKPAGSACNLHCDYCFFLKKEKLYPGSNFRMSDEVHEAYIRYMQGQMLNYLPLLLFLVTRDA
jgi:sulfatase maturation enzyme AslB (radical SAM superfamily)